MQEHKGINWYCTSTAFGWTSSYPRPGLVCYESRSFGIRFLGVSKLDSHSLALLILELAHLPGGRATGSKILTGSYSGQS